MRNGALKSALFLYGDTLILDWCVDSATQTEVARHSELCNKSVQQPSPTKNTVRRVCTHASLTTRTCVRLIVLKSRFQTNVPFLDHSRENNNNLKALMFRTKHIFQC